MLAPILAFLKLNWLYVGGAILAGLLYWKVSHEWGQYSDWKDQQAQTITDLTVSRDRAIVERASAQAAMAEKEANNIRLSLLLDQAHIAQTQNWTQLKGEIEVFEGHDLAKMATRHGKWLEKIVNKGTQEQLDEIESAFNQ